MFNYILCQVTAEHGRHVAHRSDRGFLISLIVDKKDCLRVGLLDAEHHGQPPFGPHLLQTFAHGLAQTAVIGFPKVGKAYLGEVVFGSGSHARHDGDVPFPGLADEAAFGRDGVNGVDDKVEMRSIELDGHVVLSQVFSPDGNVQFRIDVAEAPGQNIHLGTPYGRV